MDIKAFCRIIDDFIKVADEQNTGLGIKSNASEFIRNNQFSIDGLKVEISFGKGRSTGVPWIALTGYNQEVTKGIYPVFLYYKSKKKLILAYGVSDTNTPEFNWPKSSNLQSVDEYFKTTINEAAEKYGSSFVYSVYDTGGSISPEELQKDLAKIIQEFHFVFNGSTVREPVGNFTNDKTFWVIAAGKNGSLWKDFETNNICSIGWDDLGDLKQYSDKKQIQAKLKHLYEDEGDRKNDTLACYEFCNVMKPGDIVIARKGLRVILGIGTVVSDYIYDDSREEFFHIRRVDWNYKSEWVLKGEYDFAKKTLTNVSGWKDLIEQMNRIRFGEKSSDQSGPKRFWWLNANPKIWRISEYQIGQEQNYTSYNDRGNKRRIYEYFEQVKLGDLIIGYESAPVKKVIAVFEVTEGLHVDEDENQEMISFKIKEFLPNQISWTELLSIPELRDCEVLKNNQGSLFKLSSKEYEIILSKARTKLNHNIFPTYTEQQALSELFVDETKLKNILKTLEYKKNLILQGPPGTGKTFIANRLAYLKMGVKDSSRVQMIQFHQSYSYEDFIQGYRPNDQKGFELKNGIFYEFCKRAQRDPQNEYFFIIDEINRGNLSKIFGELLMLIENDKRGEEFSIPLTYSKSLDSKFYIPDNLYVIGTMNTADRSLALVDYALRRRFAFVNVQPEFGPKFQSYLMNKGASAQVVNNIVSKMSNLNSLIISDSTLGRGFEVGHSYFCSSTDSHNDVWISSIINNEVIPLITEYWFDNSSKTEQALQLLSE